MRKIISFILLISILSAAFAVLEVSAKTVESDGLLYTLYEDDTCALSGCSGTPASVTIPSKITANGKQYTVTAINDYVLSYSKNSNLRSVIIPNTVTRIGNYVFHDDENLTYVSMGKNVKSIGCGSFAACANLTKITVPNGVEYVGDGAFTNNTKMTYNEYGNGLYLGNNENKYLVMVKAENKDIVSCEINENTKFVSHAAFRECKSLTSVTLPDGLLSIGDNAFYGCDSLEYTRYDNALYLGNQNNKYMALVKAESENITSCEIHKDTKFIMDNAFSEQRELTEITIPNGVKQIGAGAFYNCGNLNSVNIPDGVRSINASAFRCAGIKSINIPGSVVIVGNRAFEECGAETIVINEGVQYIGEMAFGYCKKVESIEIPDTVSSIVWCAFDTCENLKTVRLPKTLDGISFAMFCRCKNLTEISIPDNVWAIDINAFSDCFSLKEVRLSGSVEIIGDYAFYNCSSLENLYYSGTKKQWDDLVINPGNTPLLNANLIFTGSYDSIESGDANGDGVINNKDIFTLFRYLSGYGGVEIFLSALDVNEDGSVNNKDIVTLFKSVS